MTAENAITYDYVGNIIAFESGELTDDEAIEMFAQLRRLGILQHLQGRYIRMYLALVEQGIITDPDEELC